MTTDSQLENFRAKNDSILWRAQTSSLSFQNRDKRISESRVKFIKRLTRRKHLNRSLDNSHRRWNVFREHWQRSTIWQCQLPVLLFHCLFQFFLLYTRETIIRRKEDGNDFKKMKDHENSAREAWNCASYSVAWALLLCPRTKFSFSNRWRYCRPLPSFSRLGLG